MSRMLDEIRQQPAALAHTLASQLRRVEAFKRLVEKQRPRLVVLVARGTSDNAALFGRYLLEITTGIPVSLAAPSVHTLYRRRLALGGALVVGISQPGEGTDINAVLESSKRAGATTVALTNNGRSRMAQIADETFVSRAGRERSVAATKTYTCQLMLLYMLAEALGGGDFDPLRRIPDYAAAALGLEPRIAGAVERYRFMEPCILVGRAVHFASASELAIKLMETSYVLAERFSSADFLHGPVALVERHFPVFLFAPPGKVFRDLRALAARLRRLQADSLVFSSERSILELATCPIELPRRVPDLYSPIPYIIPGQIFAARLARSKGFSPDRPRGLSKLTRKL